MSSTATAGPSTAPSSPPVVPSPPMSRSSQKLRKFIRLLQCPACSFLLKEPVSLPCGRAICKRCLPETHERKNISWPGNVGRVHGKRCPISTCGKEHAAVDCNPDVVLKKICDELLAVLKGAAASPDCWDLSTQIILDDQSGGEAPESYVLRGGTLLSAYSLAKNGLLKYDVDGTFGSRDPDAKRHDAFDERLLGQLKAALADREFLECPVCFEMFDDPVTAPPCGHTFCRLCLHMPTTRINKCPACRHDLGTHVEFYRSSCPANLALADIVAFFWPGLPGREYPKTPFRFFHDTFPKKGTFPGMSGSLILSKPNDKRMMADVAQQKEPVFGLAGYGTPPVGTLAFTDPGDHGNVWKWWGGATRFRALEITKIDNAPDAYFTARVQPIFDIPIAAEEDKEAEETAGNAGSAFGPTTEVTRDNMHRLPTKLLGRLAANLINQRMDSGRIYWLNAALEYGHCPSIPTAVPWWLARHAPIEGPELERLLRCTSVRERLKIA
ncbi:hypothetical protein VTI74DRAFT_3731 [Chaetomium olivicolor]